MPRDETVEYTDNTIPRFDVGPGKTLGPDGPALQRSTASIGDDGVVSIPAIGDGVITNYDLIVGGAEYGLIKMGDSCIGRISTKVGDIDLDGSVICQNKSGPVTGDIEFIWTESTGGTARFALPKSGVGLATYNSRSMFLAGPAPADTDFVKVSYWQAQGIFDNLVCDTVGSGAEFGVQGSAEIEGTLYCDTLAESTPAAGITADGVLLQDGDVYVALNLGHIGDPDTFMQFTPDNIQFDVGGVEMLTLNKPVFGDTEVVVNDGSADVNFRVETLNRGSAFWCNASANTVNVSGDPSTMGDGGINDYVRIGKTGDVVFVGGAGLTLAGISASDVADTIVIGAAGQGNKVQIDSFVTNDPSNNMTPDHTNDHITVLSAGIYFCIVSLHVSSAGGGGADAFGFAVYKNNGGTEFPNVHGHRRLAGGGGDRGSVGLSGLIDLAVNDTIELWCWNEDSTDNVVIDDVTMSLVQIGGT